MAESIVDRLLASDEPSIRWKTRVRVLGESPNGRAARQLAHEVRDSPRVRALLAHRGADGRLGPPDEPYAKWRGAHWILATLADIGYPPGDRSLLPARDQLMEYWLRARYYTDIPVEKKSQVYRKVGVPFMQGRARRCASQQGNALFSVLTLGLADERAQQLTQRLLYWQWPDGGWNCDRNPDARHSSFMETILPLRALALAARTTRDEATAKAARRAAEIFLKRGMFKRESDGSVMRPGFLALHYPLYWHYDILHGLKVMAEADLLGDPRCSEALDLLESKRLPDGGWPAEQRHYQVKDPAGGRAELVDWGGTSKRRSNDWVTVDALCVLQSAGRIAV